MTKLKETNEDASLKEGAIHVESSKEETDENIHSEEFEANTHSFMLGMKEVAIHLKNGGEEFEVNSHLSASVMEETAIDSEFSFDESHATMNSKAAIHIESSDEESIVTMNSSARVIGKKAIRTKLRDEDSEMITHSYTIGVKGPIHMKFCEEDSKVTTYPSTSRMNESKQIFESDHEALVYINQRDVVKTFDDSDCSLNSETIFEDNCERQKFDQSRDIDLLGQIKDVLSFHSSDTLEEDSEAEELDPLRLVPNTKSSTIMTKQREINDSRHHNTLLEKDTTRIRSIKECSSSDRSFTFNSSTTIPDKDSGREEFEPSRNLPRFRFRKNGHNSVSSLDLIYGHNEAALYSNNPLHIDVDRRSSFAISRGNKQSHKFRISKNPTKMKAEQIEAFFYNHGIEIALGLLFFALNYVVAAHGAYQFTEAGGYTTENDILRITMPIARAGGRLVTLNCAVILLTGCKCMWTLVRTHVAPIIPIGFFHRRRHAKVSSLCCPDHNCGGLYHPCFTTNCELCIKIHQIGSQWNEDVDVWRWFCHNTAPHHRYASYNNIFLFLLDHAQGLSKNSCRLSLVLVLPRWWNRYCLPLVAPPWYVQGASYLLLFCFGATSVVYL